MTRIVVICYVQRCQLLSCFLSYPLGRSCHMTCLLIQVVLLETVTSRLLDITWVTYLLRSWPATLTNCAAFPESASCLSQILTKTAPEMKHKGGLLLQLILRTGVHNDSADAFHNGRSMSWSDMTLDNCAGCRRSARSPFWTCINSAHSMQPEKGQAPCKSCSALSRSS